MSSQTKTRRLFFALWPDQEVREQLAHLVHKQVRKNGKRIPAENLHITVIFLGSADAERQQCLEAMADKIRGDRFTLTLSRVGFWPRPRILWLGPAETPAALLRLVAALNKGIQTCGLTPEGRRYAAHLTLARRASHRPRNLFDPNISWSVGSFCLVESVTAAEGAHYQVLKSWPLRAAK